VWKGYVLTAPLKHPRMCLSILFGFVAPWMAAQNGPVAYSVLSSASYDGTIAPGSLFVVYGVNLGPAQLVKAPAYPLQLQLAGTSVTVMSATAILSCPLFYSSAGAVAAILPSATPPGSAAITITYNGQPTPFPVRVGVAASAAGIYTQTSSGLGPGIFTALDGSINTFAASAKSGQEVTVWATGLGAINGPDNIVPSTFPNFPGVEVFVGTQSAHVTYAGRSGCCAGVDQINFEIPPGVAGCYVPVAIRSGGRFSNFVSIAVTSGGAACSDNAPTLPTSLINRASAGQPIKAGAFVIGPATVLQGAGFSQEQYLAERLSAQLHVKVDQKDVAMLRRAAQTHNNRAMKRALAKYAVAWQALTPEAKLALRADASGSQQGGAAAFGQYGTAATIGSAMSGLFPSQGSCTVLADVSGSGGSSSKGLDAGPSLALSGPGGSWVLAARNTGQYQVVFGSSPAESTVPPGSYTLKGTGGRDIASFSSTLNVGGTLQWTNKAAIATVDRSQPLTITWSGGTGYVLLGGYSNGTDVGSHAFACVEDASKGSFTIPGFILAALSATQRDGVIFIGPHPLSTQVQIPGLDLAYLIDGSNDTKSVGYR
jgi:uncharacterized protein (TIGR03437 family)